MDRGRDVQQGSNMACYYLARDPVVRMSASLTYRRSAFLVIMTGLFSATKNEEFKPQMQ